MFKCSTSSSTFQVVLESGCCVKSYHLDNQRAMRLRDVPLRYRSTSIIPSLHTFSIVIIETATGGSSLLSRRMSVYPGCQGLWSSEIKLRDVSPLSWVESSRLSGGVLEKATRMRAAATSCCQRHRGICQQVGKPERSDNDSGGSFGKKRFSVRLEILFWQ